jgi:hypothetical protein
MTPAAPSCQIVVGGRFSKLAFFWDAHPWGA